ncbi:MAG: winged helix-turn-helix domain-containing protein [Alphaproteobacteria bacterium]
MAFVTRPRIVLTREQLLDLTQGRETAVFDRSIDNQVSRLRKKIEPDTRTPRYIKTIWGGGYSSRRKCAGCDVPQAAALVALELRAISAAYGRHVADRADHQLLSARQRTPARGAR